MKKTPKSPYKPLHSTRCLVFEHFGDRSARQIEQRVDVEKVGRHDHVKELVLLHGDKGSVKGGLLLVAIAAALDLVVPKGHTGYTKKWRFQWCNF
jgi:hypothetical protein